MKWIEIDKDNLPEQEVLITNLDKGTYGYKECILGYLSVENDKPYAESECEILNNPTHYINPQNIEMP